MRAITFVLRGCPAGWLGAYGNEWVATPNLDRVAAEGVVFDRQISDCPDATAACRAWLTGQDHATAASALASADSGSRLTMRLRDAGVRTVLVRANHPDTDAPDWFYAGWDEVFDARPQEEDHSPLDALIRSFPGLLDRLADVTRWFVWVETDRLLPPWDVPQDVFEAYVTDEEDAPGERVTPWADPPTGPFDRSDLAAWDWLHSSFAAVVTTLDAELGRLFEQLRSRGLDQSAAWLVTSDFGYPLGEHGQIGVHRPWLHEELVHLPLLMRLPAGADAGRRVASFTQPADLAAKVLDLFGVAKYEANRESAVSELSVNGVTERAIRTADWAYLQPGPQPDGEPAREPQLYAKPDDRWEVNDLHSQHLDTAERLASQLPAP